MNINELNRLLPESFDQRRATAHAAQGAGGPEAEFAEGLGAAVGQLVAFPERQINCIPPASTPAHTPVDIQVDQTERIGHVLSRQLWGEPQSIPTHQQRSGDMPSQIQHF